MSSYEGRLGVSHFLMDDMYTHLFGDEWFKKSDIEDLAERISIEVEIPALKKLCKILGHEAVMDQCCKPEHDYCIHCGERTPNEAIRNE